MTKKHRYPAYVFDLDGVLANTEHRLNMLNEGPDIFFKNMADDTPIEASLNIWNGLCELPYVTMIILTGRPERFRRPTGEWLHANKIVADRLVMRSDGCSLTVMDYKVNAIKDIIKEHYILAVIEDNPLTAKHLRENTHAPVLLVSSGYYDADGFGHDPREDLRW